MESLDLPTNGRPIITIFGSYAPAAGEPLYEQAYAIGHALARAGYVVCNGGYDGTMEASHKGARDAGGTTIGVTCSIFNDYRGQPLKPNRFCDREFTSCDPFERIQTMLRISAGYVVLEGGTGTLSELAIVWEHVAKGLIAPRPIFFMGDFWRAMVDRLIAVRPKSGKYVHLVESPEEIVRLAREAIPTQP